MSKKEFKNNSLKRKKCGKFYKIILQSMEPPACAIFSAQSINFTTAEVTKRVIIIMVAESKGRQTPNSRQSTIKLSDTVQDSQGNQTWLQSVGLLCITLAVRLDQSRSNAPENPYN